MNSIFDAKEEIKRLQEKINELNPNSFRNCIKDIQEIVNKNKKFAFEVNKIRLNNKSLKRYNSEYTLFLQYYSTGLLSFIKNVERVLYIYYTEPEEFYFYNNTKLNFKNEIEHIIKLQRFYNTYLGSILNDMAKRTIIPKYYDELFSMYMNLFYMYDEIMDKVNNIDINCKQLTHKV